MRLEVKKLLLDVVVSCQAIQKFNDAKSFRDYEQNRLLRSATEREFEIIGEALNRLRRLAPESSAKITLLDAIVTFRHRIIHGYDSVDDLIVWNTIHEHVPALLAEVKKLLN